MTYATLNDLPGRPLGRPPTFDYALARELAALGVRQKDIATNFGVTQGRIAQIIGGVTSPTVAEALAVIEAGTRICAGCPALRIGVSKRES